LSKSVVGSSVASILDTLTNIGSGKLIHITPQKMAVKTISTSEV